MGCMVRLGNRHGGRANGQAPGHGCDRVVRLGAMGSPRRGGADTDAWRLRRKRTERLQDRQAQPWSTPPTAAAVHRPVKALRKRTSSNHQPLPRFPGTVRQVVQIDFARLSQAHEALAEGRGVELTVNLPDLRLPVVLTSTSDTARGYALTGRVANDPLSSVNVVVNGRSVAGNIRRAGELHTIRTAGAGHLVETLDGLALPRCEVGRLGDREAAQARPLQNPAVANIGQAGGAEDDGTEIDVLVVYTPSGKRSAGGHQGIRTLIELVVQETNQAYRDSDVRQRIRLVAATEVDYELQDFVADDLRHLTERADGHMDEVHEMRDLYAADLVLLFRPFGGGVAWLPEDPSAATAESLGFSVSNWHVFAHELGHNMGLMHHRANDPGNLPYPYSHGYRFRHDGVEYDTVMSDPSLALLRFSNPRHLFPNNLGVPLGVPGDTPTSSPDGPADAARSLNETAKAIANFRPSATRCQYDLPSPKDITAQGGSFAVSVATTANCPWDARSLDPWLSITEGSMGAGNGQVAFTVEQNRGWPREVALRIAGEVYSFRQEGGRQSVSVCDRSIGVREAISAALDGQPCGRLGVCLRLWAPACSKGCPACSNSNLLLAAWRNCPRVLSRIFRN